MYLTGLPQGPELRDQKLLGSVPLLGAHHASLFWQVTIICVCLQDTQCIILGTAHLWMCTASGWEVKLLAAGSGVPLTSAWGMDNHSPPWDQAASMGTHAPARVLIQLAAAAV